MLAETHIPAQWAQEEGFVDGFVTPGAAAEATRVGPEAGGVSGGVGAGGALCGGFVRQSGARLLSGYAKKSPESASKEPFRRFKRAM